MLCFDISNKVSFDELPYWIHLFKNLQNNPRENFPIVLIATKSDLEQRVSDDEIQEFMQKYELNHIFFTSFKESKSKVEEAFKIITEKVKIFDKIVKFSILNPYKVESFRNFIKCFSNCPICKKENHLDNLKNFYFSANQNEIRLKEQLTDLINLFSCMDAVRKNNLSIGIPCCNCYKAYFT